MRSSPLHLILRSSHANFRGFKALKQSTKLLFLQLRRPQDALKTYTELLTYTKSAVTRNYSEKSINNILDYVGGGKSGPVDVDTLEKFYQATRTALVEAKNEVSGINRTWARFSCAYLPASVSQDKLEACQAMARSQRVSATLEGEAQDNTVSMGATHSSLAHS